jgi:hypothetical protein
MSGLLALVRRFLAWLIRDRLRSCLEGRMQKYQAQHSRQHPPPRLPQGQRLERSPHRPLQHQLHQVQAESWRAKNLRLRLCTLAQRLRN